MNIVILFSGQYPGIGAASRRVENYVKGLKQLNNNVEIVSLKLNIKNPLLSLLSGWIMPIYTLFKLIQLNKNDSILLVYGFGWMSKLMIIFYSKLKESKVILEVNEKPYSIIGGSKRDAIFKHFKNINIFILTRMVYPLADGFVVISDALYSFINQYKSKKSKIIKIPIIVDSDYYQIKTDHLSEFHKPYLLHSASLNNHKDGIIDVFRAHAIVLNKYHQKLHFYLTSKTGLTSIKDEINRITENEGTKDYIHFLGDIDEKKLLKYQQNCDLVVINKVDSEQNRYNFATKIGEYLALGKPIITTPIGEVTSYLKNERDCLYIPPNNPEMMAEKIIEILNNKELRYSLKENARKSAKEHFDYKKNIQKFQHFLNEIQYV